MDELLPNNFSILDSALDRRELEYQNVEDFNKANSNLEQSIMIDDENYLIKFRLYDHEIISEGPYFNYKINADGFRTKHFEKNNNKNLNILFSGCSFTHGAGLPAEYAWPAKVENMISKISDKTIESRNIALGGSNVFQICKNLRVYINKYGKPDYLFVLFPGFERTIKYQDQNNSRSFIKVTITPPHHENYKKNNGVKHFMESYVIEESILFATDYIHNLEFICNLLDIKLIWSVWSKDYQKMSEKLGFSNYIDIPSRESYTIEENKENEPYWDMARDKNHPGIGYHKLIADKFFSAFSSIYNNKDVKNV
jgi:hypothetical protein